MEKSQQKNQKTNKYRFYKINLVIIQKLINIIQILSNKMQQQQYYQQLQKTKQIKLLHMQGEKEKYNKNYIDCIIKNHNFISPAKNYDLGLSSQRLKNGNKPEQLKLFNTPKYQMINVSKINTIFKPTWRNDDKNQTNAHKLKTQQLIEIFLKKNQQIAASLIKDKKSLSDAAYNLGKESKYTRYSQQQSTNNLAKVQNNCKLQKSQLLPKINNLRTTPTAVKQIDYEDVTEVIIVLNQKLANSQQQLVSNKTQITEQVFQSNYCSSLQPISEDITNTNIKRFLKLKQHTYEKSEQKYNSQHLSLKKKKIQSHKKRMAKKQKDQHKNSLQGYLQAKMVLRQDIYQQIRTSSKPNDKKQQTPKPQQQLSKSMISEQKKNTTKNTNTNQNSNNNNKSLPKSNKKIGLNTKISKKYLLNLVDSQITIYQQKIKSYREFIFLIKMVHNIFDTVVLADQSNKNQHKYKYYVGKGNNRQLVIALMKRRFWWVETDDINEANFVWTQLKINSFYPKQTINSRTAAEFYQNQMNEEQNKKLNKKKGKKISNLYKASFPDIQQFKIMTTNQYKLYQQYINQIQSSITNPQRFNNYQNRKKYLPYLKQSQTQPKNIKVHNHLQNNFYIGNKKALYYNLKKYCELSGKNLFDIVPLTFHINQQGVNSQAYKQFLKHYKSFKLKKDCKNIWIVKPGQNSNRGNGISVFDELYQINKIITSQNKNNDKGPRTFIIQKYIQRPLLYKGRKFDIRHYMLATKIYGKMRLYFYGEGYVRTSSSNFDLSQIGDNQIHLTNDAIQKYSDNYGKYQQGNKISYTELQRYIDSNYPNRKYSLVNQFYPKIKQIALDTFKACYLTMDPQNLAHNFQVFGLDFMIDSNFNVWLIQVNTNPCLQLSSNLLSRIIPTMLQHSFRLTIDPLFPPNCHYLNSLKHLVPDNPLQRLQYELIFDQSRDGKQVQNMYKDQSSLANNMQVEEQEDEFDNDGKEIQIDIQ